MSFSNAVIGNPFLLSFSPPLAGGDYEDQGEGDIFRLPTEDFGSNNDGSKEQNTIAR